MALEDSRPATVYIEASAFTVDLSPKSEVELGCGNMDGEVWKIESSPQASFLALRNPGGKNILLVSIDALYPGAAVRDAIVESATPAIHAEDILIAATHTHAAPMLDSSKPALGTPDPQHLQEVLRKLSDATREVLHPDRFKPASLKAGSGRADHSANRRLRKRVVWRKPLRFNVMRLAPNFRGSRDEEITVLQVIFHDGSPGTLIWNYACHPVRFPSGRTVSAHFPGMVRDQIRDTFPNIADVLFFQGFSGDTRPSALAEPKIPEGPRQLYRRIRFGPSWRSMSLETYSSWASSLAKRVSDVIEQVSPLQSGTIRTSEVLADREDFVSPAGPPVVFQALDFMTELTIVGISAEVMSELASYTRKRAHTKYVMCVSCTADTVGYLPTKRMLKEGGYEAAGFLPHFNLSGVNTDVEANTRSGIAKVIAKLAD